MSARIRLSRASTTRLLEHMRPNVLEDREPVLARVFEGVARAVRNLEGAPVGFPAAFLQSLRGVLEVLDLVHRHAARRGTVVGKEQERALPETERRDVRPEAGVVPHEFTAKDVAVVREV